jgi:hypothetical protein
LRFATDGFTQVGGVVRCGVRNTLPVLVWITMEQCSSDMRMDAIELGAYQPLKEPGKIDSGKVDLYGE